MCLEGRLDAPDVDGSVSVVGVPDRRLRGYMQGYLGFAERFAGVSRQLEVPTGGVVLVVLLGPALRVDDPRHGEGAIVHRGGFVAGLHDGPVVTETMGGTCGVQVSLTPLGARRFLGLPMDAVANRAVDLEDLLGARGRRLVERVREAPDWRARFRLLDDALLVRVAETELSPPEVVWVWRQLVASSGQLPIASLATEIGWSRRRLVAGFRTEVGLAPKLFARVVRFRRAVQLAEMAEQGDEVRWAEVAQVCGYYDQAHLIRDFARFAGSAPNAFLVRRLQARSATDD